MTDVANSGSEEMILSFLAEAGNEFVSGEAISDKLGLTRAAVWKHVESLRAQVLRTGAHAGVAFDGDADRAVVVDELGKMVPAGAVGDLISLRRKVLELKNGLLAGKAFDNRASVAAVAVCLEQLQQAQHQWDVVA